MKEVYKHIPSEVSHHCFGLRQSEERREGVSRRIELSCVELSCAGAELGRLFWTGLGWAELGWTLAELSWSGLG